MLKIDLAESQSDWNLVFDVCFSAIIPFLDVKTAFLIKFLTKAIKSDQDKSIVVAN